MIESDISPQPKRRVIIIGLAVILMGMVVLVAMPAFKRHVEWVNCSSNIHAILFVSAILWPDDHGGQLPSDFISMSNELSNPKILICPSDHLRQPATSWASLTTNNCSYEIVAPGIRQSDTNTVFLRCKIHGYAGYADDRLLDASGKLVKPETIW